MAKQVKKPIPANSPAAAAAAPAPSTKNETEYFDQPKPGDHVILVLPGGIHVNALVSQTWSTQRHVAESSGAISINGYHVVQVGDHGAALLKPETEVPHISFAPGIFPVWCWPQEAVEGSGS